MTTSHPTVTALLPSYNAAEFIEGTLASLAAQTWPNLEILIADDCSTDGTREIIRAFASNHPNVRVIENETNLGWLGNCNAMMKAASGEYMFFAFHDDTVAPSYVEKLATALREQSDTVLSYGNASIISVEGSEQAVRFTKLNGLTTAFERGMVMTGKPSNWWVPNRGLFRASTAAKVGYIPRHASGEFIADWLWLLALSLEGTFVHVDETLCRKYYKATSLSRNWKHAPRKYWHLWLRARRVIDESDLQSSEKHTLTGRAARTMFKSAINLRAMRPERKKRSHP